MPIYEYRCPNGHTFEMFQKMSDAPAETCESCGAGPVEKVLFPVAVHYKGSGFYSTDYGRASRKGGAKDGEGGGGSGEKSEKGDKSEKGEKGEKSEKSEKSDSSGKKESAKDTGSSDKKSTAAD